MSLSIEDRASIVAKAMEWNFGNLLTWERPALAHTFGDNDLGRVDAFEKKLVETRTEVLAFLEQMPDEDLLLIQEELLDDFRISERNRAAISTKKIEWLRRAFPPPIAYGFGHSSFAANFEYWARMPTLSLHEVSLLSLGADPNCMKDDKFVDLKKTLDRGNALWSAHRLFLEQREIFRRCYHYTGFGYAAEPIGSIKHWIDDLEIQVHPQFYEGLEARTKPKILEEQEDNAREPRQSSKGTRDQEVETLLKMIAVMAVKGYAFDPDSMRNQATADIQSDLDLLGIPLDQKTILKWMREACKAIPQD